MAYEKCPKCGFMHYATDKCSERVVTIGAKPILLNGKPVTAGDLRPGTLVNIVPTPAGYEVAPKRSFMTDDMAFDPTPIINAEMQRRGRGRPKTISDMRTYKAMKERERRARLKASKA